MGRLVRFAVVAAMLGLAMPLTGTAAATPQQMADVIVVLHDGVDARGTAHEMARTHGARVGHVYEHALAGFAAEVPEGRLAGLQRDPRVAYVNENQVLHAVEYTDGVTRIDGDDAHALELATKATGLGVRVAVLDTGIDLDHPDLRDNIDTASAKDCTNPLDTTLVADDDQGHGTHVAGTIAAGANNSQVVGVAPTATLVPVKVLNSSGSGSWDQVICGINHVTSLKGTSKQVHVANMSLGAAGSFDGMSCANETNGSALFDALCGSIESGTTYTLAAGNDGKNASGFVPAAHPDAITVSAFSDTNGQYDSSTTCSGKGPWKTCDEAFASFSNYGSIVDVIAPGVNIVSTTMGGGTGSKSGTSMAAPHVAGVAALILQQFVDLTPAQVAAHLQGTGQCPDGLSNLNTGYCVDQQTWNSDPDSPATEPMVNALTAVTTTPTGNDLATGPTASFTYDCPDLDCTFDGSGSTGSITTYAWDFGDTTTATGSTATHTYEAAGTYAVTLTVTHDGSTDSETKQVSVTAPEPPPSGDFSLDAVGYKVKGAHEVKLDWTGGPGTFVDVREDGKLVVSATPDDGAHTYVPNPPRKGGGTFQYTVCEAGSLTVCSNTVTVTF